MDQKPAPPLAPSGSQTPLPPERAFVVQLRSQSDPAGDLFVGRAEHIASGAETRFDSIEALVAFITGVLVAAGASPAERSDSTATRQPRS